MTPANNNVLERISKLLAMQESRGATEAEAQLAAEHVQRLLQEHNLTMSEVEAHGGKSDSPTAARTKTTLRVVKNKRMQWRVTLLEGLGRSHFCLVREQVIYEAASSKRRKRILLVGREINTRAVQMTFDYLEAACRRALSESGYPMTEGGNYTLEASYFLDGMAERVVERLEERRRERERESELNARAADGEGRALILSDVYGTEAELNNDHLNGFPPGTTATQNREWAARQAHIESERKRLEAEGLDPTVAYYLAHGYSQERAEAAATGYAQRSSQSRSRGRRSRTGWARGEETDYRRQNSPAFRQGKEAGTKVGLDAWVETGSARVRIGRAK